MCSAKGKNFNNILYVRNIDLTKGQAYSYEKIASSRQRGCYMRTITARAQLENIFGHGPEGA
jgi:hypothetical protein